MDREHDAVAEAVVALAAVAGDDEAGRLERRIVVAVEHGGQRLPGVRRIADPEPGGNRAGEPAFLEIGDGARRLLQLRPIEPGGFQREGGEVAGLGAPLGLAGALDARHFEAGVARELLDRVRKRLAAVLHQEADRRAMGAAPEAVVELLGRTDGERGRLFVVERTAGLVVRAGLLERDVAVDDIDDVDPGKQRLYEIVRNHELDAAPGGIAATGRPRLGYRR